MWSSTQKWNLHLYVVPPPSGATFDTFQRGGGGGQVPIFDRYPSPLPGNSTVALFLGSSAPLLLPLLLGQLESARLH